MSNKYYQTRDSILEYIDMARGYDGRYIISRLKGYLSLKSEVLEIGSGPGTDWNILNEYYTITGSDNSKEFLKHLTENNPEGKFIYLDAVSLSTKLKFDAIYSNKVLHHLTDEELETSIARQYEILNSRGVICHSFWAGEGSETHNGIFLNHQTIKRLRGFFAQDFEIQANEHYKEFEPGDSVFLTGIKK